MTHAQCSSPPSVNQHREEFGLLHASSVHKPVRGLGRLPVCLTLTHTRSATRTQRSSSAKGAHPKVIQTSMGHASIKVTLDLYGHLFPGVGAELAERLDIARSVILDEGQVFSAPTGVPT